MIGGMSKQAPTEQHPENGYLTPSWLVDRIRKDVFGGVIELDPCTTQSNPVNALTFIAPPEDGILSDWHGWNIYVNPPYGRTIAKWIEKALMYSRAERRVVLLVPARTDSRWFQELLNYKCELLLFKGRLSFSSGPAPFPSALFAFNCSLGGMMDLGARVIR